MVLRIDVIINRMFVILQKGTGIYMIKLIATDVDGPLVKDGTMHIDP